MPRQRANNPVEEHIDSALDASPEYHALRDLIQQDVFAALSSYRGGAAQL